ncbi:MAG TPA: hypothetical protein VLC48_07620 [Gemmatimonadota bacterium]|nr:hypothetical protein [Gemmatimonadota bacterium]
MTTARMLAATLVLAGAWVTNPSAARAQDRSTAATAGGAALGLYSGALLGLAGSTVPCAQVSGTRTCARVALGVGGVAGGVAGGLLGDADTRAVEDAFRAAGYGALAGAAVGVLVKELVYYYDWGDVLAFTALGSAIGPVWPGAALGLAAGGALGFGLYLVFPTIEFTDAVALGGVGLAVGGLAAWAIKAADARSEGGNSAPSLTVNLLNLRF